MAEYRDVIKQFKRMCRYYNGRTHSHDCPLYCQGHGCNISHCRMLAFEDKKFASVVMAWAAEHPGPVYPTWYEWLNHIGVLGTAAIGAGYVGERLCTMHIPADIAEKLGIQPKED